MAQTPSFPRENLAVELEALNAKRAALEPDVEGFNTTLEAESQTDKPIVKLCSCIGCGRPLVVNQFYAQGIAKCRSCKGESAGTTKASVGMVQPGRTDPAAAANLVDCLINKEFANALCPVHPNDPEHVMELKAVSHNEYHGPSEIIGWKGGVPEIRQLDKGETVMHQCLKCRATVSYSTTAQSQFRRINEVKSGKSVNGWAGILGTREES